MGYQGLQPKWGSTPEPPKFRHSTFNKPHQAKNDAPGALLLFQVVEH